MRTESDVQDRQFIRGFVAFCTTSISCYLLSIWPFLMNETLPTAIGLRQACLVGLGPASLVGAIAARRFSSAGATGWIAATLTTAIFLWVRFQQLFIAGEAKQGAVPEYSRDLQWVLPVANVVLAIVVSLVVAPRERPTARPETPTNP